MVEMNNNAIENNDAIMIIANAFKEKAVLTWYKGIKALCESKGKSAFKKAAQKRLESFENFAIEDDPIVFSESGPLCEITRSAWAIANAASKGDPTGTTPMGSLGVGLGIADESSIASFKEALVQATAWAARQVKNEKAQAKAKAEVDKAAKKAVEALFNPLFEGEDLKAWTDDKASDEAFLKAGKILIIRIQALIRAELRTVAEQGSGSTARANAILNEVKTLCSDMEQGLSDKSLHLLDKDGQKIWGQSSKLLVGTTAKKILEACQVKMSALQGRVDRTLSRLSALEGAAKIIW